MPTVLTIYFENPFWVAVLERIEGDEVQAARFVFGAKPSEAEIDAFVQADYVNLLDRLSEPVPLKKRVTRSINPKRQQRQIQKEVASSGVRTKSQEALRLEMERHKRASVQRRKDRAHEEAEYKRMLKVEKRKKKRRGH